MSEVILENCKQMSDVKHENEKGCTDETIVEKALLDETLKEESSTKVINDEFNYLKRNEFTSEIYKIEVRNLGYFGIGVRDC